MRSSDLVSSPHFDSTAPASIVKRCYTAWIMSAKSLEIRAMAFISSQNHPMLVRTFKGREEDELKFHYVAHTALDVIEERRG